MECDEDGHEGSSSALKLYSVRKKAHNLDH